MNPLEALALTFAALFCLSAGVLFLASLINAALFVVRLARQPKPRPIIEEDAEYLRFAAEQERITLARLEARDHTAA